MNNQRGQVKCFRYVYNPLQADFYIQNGEIALGVGIGEKGGFYVMFKDSCRLQELYSRWCSNKVNNK